MFIWIKGKLVNRNNVIAVSRDYDSDDESVTVTVSFVNGTDFVFKYRDPDLFDDLCERLNYTITED